MMRNDYRRSLILFRSNADGFSGHARLERRTLMGTIYFQMQAGDACPALRVALVGRDRSGGYFACGLGETLRDARGQAVMSYSFDPRNICGRELEQYQLIAVTCAGDEGCEVVLFGNVCGHAELNWDEVRAALRRLYAGAAGAEPESPAPDSPVAPLPEPAEPIAPAPATELPSESAAPSAGVEIEVAEGAGETSGAPAVEIPAAGVSEGVPGAAAGEIGGISAPDVTTVATGAAEAASPASELVEAQGVRLDAPWPEDAEPLRALFEREAALTDAPDGDCVYVAAPMPEGCGYPYAAAGVRILDGALVAVRYALPAAWTADAPAGLEDYDWVGDQNSGWWRIEIPLDC